MTVPEKTPSDYFHCGAGDWNAFARAANAHLAGEGMAAPPPVPILRNASIVRVENVSGSDVSRFGVLGIDGVTITPTDNADEFKARPCVEGYTPDIDEHRGRYVVTVEPIAAGEIGKAVVAGLAVVGVLVLDEDHRWAEMYDGVTVSLISAATGSARILWKESGVGLKWALVRLGNAVHHVEYGKPTTTFSQGTTITLAVCEADGTDIGAAANVTIDLSVRGDNVEHPFSTSNVLTFVRYEDPSASADGVLIGFPNGTYSSPLTLYNTAEGSETAQTDDWDRNDQGAYDGVVDRRVVRVVYNEAGDKVLYGFYRDYTYDSIGKLAAISAETRFTIDAATDCAS